MTCSRGVGGKGVRGRDKVEKRGGTETGVTCVHGAGEEAWCWGRGMVLGKRHSAGEEASCAHSCLLHRVK